MTKPCSKCGQPKVKSNNGRWRCRPCDNTYQRAWYAADPDKLRKRKREHMRRLRADPEKREAMNAFRRGNPAYQEKGRNYNRILRTKHFFRWRARLLNRTGRNVTPQQLAALWKGQRGHCALSGLKLGKDAHVDHIIPRAKGGKTEVGNLRWLDPWVNVALQDLSDAEFVRRCTQVAEYIGNRILASLPGCP